MRLPLRNHNRKKHHFIGSPGIGDSDQQPYKKAKMDSDRKQGITVN